jgi:hypothetical protein
MLVKMFIKGNGPKVPCSQFHRFSAINTFKFPQAPDQGSTVDFLVSLPEEHHERRKFCRRGGNPRTCDSGSAIDS